MGDTGASQAPHFAPKDENSSAGGPEVDSETLSPLWFAGIYENHFKYQPPVDPMMKLQAGVMSRTMIDPDTIALPSESTLGVGLSTLDEFELDFSQALSINPRSLLASLESIAECGVTLTEPLRTSGVGDQAGDHNLNPGDKHPGLKTRSNSRLALVAKTIVTKKLGAASIQEDMIRNKEYFANLQKCYNPSVEFGDFTRSHSSEEVLGPSKIDRQNSNKSSSTKLLKRSHTYSVLSLHRQGQGDVSVPSVSAFSRIIEKRESLAEEKEEAEEKIFSESLSDEDYDDEEAERNRSIQKLRGILKSKLKADAIVQNIKFRLEDHDKIGDQIKFPKKTKRILRSPPPCDLYLRQRLTDAPEDDDGVDGDDANGLLSPMTKSNFVSPSPKSKAHFAFFTSVSRSSSECQIQENYQNYESSFCDSDKAKRVLGLLPSHPHTSKVSSPLPRDVELSELERKSIQRRLSFKPSFTRTATNTAIIAPPDYRMSPSNSGTLGFYEQFIKDEKKDPETEQEEEEDSYSEIEMDDSVQILKKTERWAAWISKKASSE